MSPDDEKKGWEIPYIPPWGIVPECLLPDDCDSHRNPGMSRPLEPLERFDRPPLRTAGGDGRPDRDALDALRLFIAKECAGLAHEWRPDIAGLRGAFHTGEFTMRHRTALRWAFSGMRKARVFPCLVAGAKLPIFEVARCFWKAFDGCAFGCAPWLNQWADDPWRPHPSVQKTPLVRFDREYCAGINAPVLVRMPEPANPIPAKPDPRHPGPADPLSFQGDA